MNLRDVYKPTPFLTEVSHSLKDFLPMLDYDNVDFDPPYQRGDDWTLAQQQAFMGHLLSGGDVLPLVFQRVPDMGNAEIVDGKQRATSIVRWLKGEIYATMFDGRMIHKNDVTAGLGIVEIRVKYINLPFEERKQFYVRFNSAGTPHTEAQLMAALRARPKSVGAKARRP